MNPLMNFKNSIFYYKMIKTKRSIYTDHILKYLKNNSIKLIKFNPNKILILLFTL